MARWNAKGCQVKYEVLDRVKFRYRVFDLATDEFLGHTVEWATVTRVWNNDKYVTIVTDSGKTFTRDHDSLSLRG
jgi:hypothetical protein